MKTPILLNLMMGLLSFALVACGDDASKDEQSSDANETESEQLDGGDTDENATDSVEDPAPTCQSLNLCIEEGGSYFCPPDVAEGRSCKTLVACEDSVVCASDEEACMVECDRVDCAILDTDPELVQCPDR